MKSLIRCILVFVILFSVAGCAAKKQSLPASEIKEGKMTHIKEEMKRKAKEFSAYEIKQPGGSKIDLTLLPEPIHVYTDIEGGREFGAVFAFALPPGENPEVLIAFESVRGEVSYSCEIVRLGGAEMHVLWKGREIWKSNYGSGNPRERIPNSYINFRYADLEGGKL